MSIRFGGSGTGTYVPVWQPNTAYLADQTVLSPAGEMVRAKAAFTSGATYSASNWTPAAIMRNAVPRSRGALVLTFDDGYTTWPSVQTVLDARNQRATFNVQTNKIDAGGGVTTAQLAALFAAGHEIGSHTVTHASMATLTSAQRQSEWDNSKAALEAIVGAGNVRTFAYPAGSRNATTDQEAYLRYDNLLLVAGAGYNEYVYPLEDREAFLIQRFNWFESSHAQFLRLIAYAAKYPVLVVVMCHDLDGASLGPTLAEFTAAMDSARSLDVPVLTVDEAFQSTPLLMDPGFEDTNLDQWYLTRADSANQNATSDADTPDTGLTGSRSLHIVSTVAGSVQRSQMCPMRPGVEYTLSFRYRITAGTTAYARFGHFDAVRTSATTTTVASLSSTTWARATVAANGHARARMAQIEFGVTGVGEMWVDHVHFGPTKETAVG